MQGGCSIKLPEPLPPHLRAQMPEVQLTAGFADDAAGVPTSCSFATPIRNIKKWSLANALAAQNAMTPIFLRHHSLQSAFIHRSCPSSVKKGGDHGSHQAAHLRQNEAGELVLSGWSENVVADQLAAQVVADCVVYAYRVIAVVEARDQVMATKIKKKKDLAKAADVEMSDATKPGPIDSINDRQSSLPRLKASTTVSNRFTPVLIYNPLSILAAQKGFWQEEIVDVHQHLPAQAHENTQASHPAPDARFPTPPRVAKGRPKGSRRTASTERQGEAAGGLGSPFFY
jgi:hypothetical protein